MKNMKISTKLFVSFLAITAFSILLACVSIIASVSINGNYTYLLEEPIERQDLLKDMRLQFTMMRYRTANYAMEVNNPDIITGTLTPQFESAYTAFTTALTAYQKNNNADYRRDSGVIKQNSDNAEKLRKLVDEFKLSAESTRAIALSGDYDSATTSLRDVIPLATEINTLFDEMLTPATEYVNSESIKMDQTAFNYTIAQIIVTVICIGLSILLAFYISGLIGKPVRYMKDVLYKIGRLGVVNFSDAEYRQAEEYAKARDEVGESIKMLIETARRLETVGGALETVASGDLTAEITLLSNEDVMGVALQKMTDNLNNLFSEINSSTTQVAAGSKQIADGSQALAQGSTEQAAAVEQLSSSISEIADKTKENADMAVKAANLANAIMNNAEKGSRQMDEMMIAVKEINEASQSINKVIKVIEDIAFQTNILALNAAVEAARAGQHGKGFAVVAEEVRNLAAKSADAAKDTGGLIVNSMEKAELGARIAGETALSLTEIVSGISESNKLVGDIAKSSEEQSAGISQINRGIDQVAQVVQQNSATAEESSAASEELSGQSDMLEQLISQFKLKNSSTRHSAFSSTPAQKRLVMPAKSSAAAYNNQNDGYGKY